MPTCCATTSTNKDNADASLIYATADGEITASCSVWWRRTPLLDGKPTGYIGHYAAEDEESGRAILQAAVEQLRAHKCVHAIGPIDGSTWRQYRFITATSDAPLFLFETANPVNWPLHFLRSGFDVCAKYTSALNEDLTIRDPRARDAGERLARMGVSVRAFDLKRSDEELGSILKLSRQAFAENFLYSDISDDEFFEKYRALLPIVIPELILMMEYRGELVGYAISVPNVAKFSIPGCAILKTLARQPRPEFAGAGSCLMDLVHQRAEELGFSSVIHAFMIEDNHSRKISDRTALCIREYSLFSRKIA